MVNHHHPVRRTFNELLEAFFGSLALRDVSHDNGVEFPPTCFDL